MIAWETTPAVALRMPESEVASLVSPETWRLVVVALVEVVLRVMRLLMVEEAEIAMPMVVVGESALFTIDQSLKEVLMKSTPGMAAITLLDPSVLRSDEVRPARLRTPVDEKDEVAVPPKYAD